MSNAWNMQLDATASTAGPAPTAPAYLRGDDRCRWERMRQAKMLYKGAHRAFFLDESRTQYPFTPLLVNGQKRILYATFNMLRLVSNTIADLLVGTKPRITAGDDSQSPFVDDFLRNSLIHSRLHIAAKQCSWAGGAFAEVMKWNGQVYAENVAPDQIYPQGVALPNGQYERYVRYATEDIGAEKDGRKTQYLLETIYEPGAIRRQLSIVGVQGEKIGENVPLNQWPAFKTITPQPIESTGVDVNTIVYFPNMLDEEVSISDYENLVNQQDTINAKFSQVARVLVKHADPKVWFDATVADETGNVRISHEAFFGAVKPEYITWQAELDAAMKDREAAIFAFCTAAEMSPVLLGIKQGGTPDAARKLRLEATKDLAKVAGKALLFEPATARLVELAMRLDQAGPLLRSRASDSIGVHFQDGLPIDPKEQADVAATWRSAGLLDLEDGVAMRVDDPEAAASSIARIRAEESAKTPSIVLGEPNETLDPAATVAA